MNEAPLRSWIDRVLSARPPQEVWARARGEASRAQVRAGVTQLERLFELHGIGPGSTAAVRMAPSFTYLWTVLALWRRGAQVIVLDPRLTRIESDRLVHLCEPQYMIDSGTPRAIRVVFHDECEVRVTPRHSGHPAGSPHVLLQFSSGSTGYPKVIGRTAESLLAEIERFAADPAMPVAGERVLLANSLTHSFGLIGGVLHALGSGATLVFAPDAQPRSLLTTLSEARANVLFGVPFHFELLTRLPETVPLPDLRIAVSGGEAIRPELFSAFEDRYGLRIGQAYGMTEVGIVATDLTGRHAPPAVGHPVPGIEVQVRHGELYVRTDASPYLYATDAANRYADGWLRTHDVCEVDEETGVLSIRGRTDALVVIGGLKVDLTEVEAALVDHPRVTEAVVLFSDTIEAFVAADRGVTAQDLHTWCRARLSQYKIPRRFQLAAQIPRTTNGKLIRNREVLASRLATTGSAAAATCREGARA